MVFLQLFKKILCCLAFSCTVFLALPATAVEHIAPPALSSIENSDIESLLPSNEIKLILAGDTEFLSLYSEYMSSNFRGVVLLIPDWHSVPTNNSGMNFLRKELNNLGYTTYAMTVPDIDWQAKKMKPATPTDAPEKPAVNESKDNANEPAKQSEEPHYVSATELINNDVLDDYKTNLILRYEALYQTAMAEPNNIVVIAQGASAGMLLEYYADFPESKINAFISLSSYLPNAQRNEELSQATSLVTPALLDIYYTNDSTDILLSLKNRKRWVNRNAKFDYRQRQLFGMRNAPQQHARLSKEIDGFLRRLF
ncbi:DUF3530 family protein [Pseudoalteromonas carrageenovora]|uniref:DUF3530 family protein n=1 Tax=Pseudoalteromonas carrageenovora TaxID=227 RepID=UPI00311E960A